jgi:hypothetical protein
MINCKESARKWSWVIEVLSMNLPGAAEENYEKPQ